MRTSPRNRDGNRKGNSSRVLVGGRQVHIPPALRDGQARCPVCRQAVTLTPTGRLRKHLDLTGYECTNRATTLDPVRLDELPDVVIPGQPAWRPREPWLRQPSPATAAGPRAYGYCETCGALVSGERRFCGICLARRMSER